MTQERVATAIMMILALVFVLAIGFGLFDLIKVSLS